MHRLDGPSPALLAVVLSKKDVGEECDSDIVTHIPLPRLLLGFSLSLPACSVWCQTSETRSSLDIDKPVLQL